MPEDGTSLHEEDNRQSIELLFRWSNIVTTAWIVATKTGTTKKSVRATKGRLRSSIAKGANSKANIASKGNNSNKRGALASEREPSKLLILNPQSKRNLPQLSRKLQFWRQNPRSQIRRVG